eukprot:scaffold72363_cov60-Phaeocystis_antarctica.AAC.3
MCRLAPHVHASFDRRRILVTSAVLAAPPRQQHPRPSPEPPRRNRARQAVGRLHASPRRAGWQSRARRASWEGRASPAPRALAPPSARRLRHPCSSRHRRRRQLRAPRWRATSSRHSVPPTVSPAQMLASRTRSKLTATRLGPAVPSVPPPRRSRRGARMFYSERRRREPSAQPPEHRALDRPHESLDSVALPLLGSPDNGFQPASPDSRKSSSSS